jgi:hypothetical protein
MYNRSLTTFCSPLFLYVYKTDAYCWSPNVFFPLQRKSLKMKSQPACVTLEEEDPATGDAKPDTRTSAAIFLPPEEWYKRRRERRKSDKKLTIDGKSELLGSIGDAIKNDPGHESLNLLMGEHEDDPEWILLEKQSMKLKIFYMPGD